MNRPWEELKAQAGALRQAAERQHRNEAIFDLWLAGETIRDVAKRFHMGKSQIADIITLSGRRKAEATGQTEKPPIYNVWNYGSCDPRFGQEHPGRIPGQAVVKLLLWLTRPFDLVVDPMAGGGTTIDVCRYLLRRYRCSDIDPKRTAIHPWDIRQGFPHLPRKPDLIFLDPPLLAAEEGRVYSGDGAAMGSYEEWLAFTKKLARDSFRTVRGGGHVGLMVESFLDERETGRFLGCDCVDLFLQAGFEGVQEISVNKAPDKAFRDVEYARGKGILLDLKRELFVFRKGPCLSRSWR